MDNIDEFIRLAFLAGRPEVGWWLVGAMLESAATLRKTLPDKMGNKWDVDFNRINTAYQTSTPSAPQAVLLGSQARLLLKQAIEASAAPSKQYMATLLDTWMAAIQPVAPGVSLEPLRKAKKSIPNWAWAVGATTAALALRWLLSGSEKACEQEVIVVTQLEQ